LRAETTPKVATTTTKLKQTPKITTTQPQNIAKDTRTTLHNTNRSSKTLYQNRALYIQKNPTPQHSNTITIQTHQLLTPDN